MEIPLTIFHFVLYYNSGYCITSKTKNMSHQYIKKCLKYIITYVCFYLKHIIDLTVSVHTVKRHVELTLQSSNKTIRVAKKKPGCTT